MSNKALFQIRATRSNPPGRASEADRRKTYGAALAQFDELLTAARAVGPAARPLPLFYALSQAGRAIAAAHLDDPWRLRGHGLTTKDMSGPVLDVKVKPVNDPAKTSRGTIDSFRGVAKSVGGELLPPVVTVREMWSSLPEVFEFLHGPVEAIPLLLVPTVPHEKLHDWTRAQASVVGFSGRPEDLEDHLKEHFPSARGVQVEQATTVPGTASVLTPHGFGVSVSWPSSKNIGNHIKTLDRIAPGADLQARWMRPGVGGIELYPLMTWWMTMYGLSMLARYEPDVWLESLDYDVSAEAAGLTRLLEVGCDRVSDLVLDALTGKRTSYVIER